MIDLRIEAAAREIKRLFSKGKQADDAMWLSCANCVLDAVDAAAWMPMDSAPRDGSRILIVKKQVLYAPPVAVMVIGKGTTVIACTTLRL